MSEQEALELMNKAVKKATQTGFFSNLFGNNAFEEAAELYIRAANNFKMCKKWTEAGDAFCKAADMYSRSQDPDEAATSYVNASKCYKKSNPEEAIDSLKFAIDILTDRGRFHSAAKYQKEMAEIYENELIDIPKAMECYECASDWFSGEDLAAMANNCQLKVATFAGQLEQYEKAIQIFEKVASDNVDNQLMKWSLKDFFLKAGLCHLATGDSVGSRRALERYQEMDPNFNNTREFKFLSNLIDDIDAADVESFTMHVAEYDNLSKLDPWKTSLLLKIKKTIDEEPGLT